MSRGWILIVAASLVPGCVFGHMDDDGGIFDDDDEHDDDDFDDDDGVSPPPSSDTGNDNDAPLCPVGAPGCPCTGAGGCDPSLECIASIHTCVIPDPCPIGAAGCECTRGGTCDPGFICKEEVCVSEMPCLPENTGTEGCQCTGGGACDPGLECWSDFCVLPEGAADSSGSTAA
jgi:hypothetical protein